MIQHGRAGIKEILQSRMFKGESQRAAHFWSELLLAVNSKHISSIVQNVISAALEAMTDGSQVQSLSELKRKFEVTLGKSVRLCLKK